MIDVSLRLSVFVQDEIELPNRIVIEQPQAGEIIDIHDQLYRVIQVIHKAYPKYRPLEGRSDPHLIAIVEPH